MSDHRRSLIQGLKETPVPVDPNVEKNFVRSAKTNGMGEGAQHATSAPAANPVMARAPISTRIRADMATALKRASLERQLNGREPNTLQDILEEAIEPWLQSNGYLQ